MKDIHRGLKVGRVMLIVVKIPSKFGHISISYYYAKPIMNHIQVHRMVRTWASVTMAQALPH